MSTAKTSAIKRYYIFFAVVAVFSALAIVVNFIVRRGPVHDAAVVRDLRTLQPAVDSYYLSQSHLPVNLGSVDLDGSSTAARLKNYTYRVVGPTRYELCGTFLTENLRSNEKYAQPSYQNGVLVPEPDNHGKGYQCFIYTVVPIGQVYPLK